MWVGILLIAVDPIGSAYRTRRKFGRGTLDNTDVNMGCQHGWNLRSPRFRDSDPPTLLSSKYDR
jgi:hypothetical protein